MDDDLIIDFITECREHLQDIEADLLLMEEMGANIDDQLVNKVFRAAHSIKGGSGFFGLQKIMNLAHKAETALDLVRSGKLVPNAEVINIFLNSFDKLRDLINNYQSSEEADTQSNLLMLEELIHNNISSKEKKLLKEEIELFSPDLKLSTVQSGYDIERFRQRLQYIYFVQYDLINDIERAGKNILDVFKDLYKTGEILDSKVDFDSVGSLDDPITNKFFIDITFATILDPEIIGGLIEVDKEKITVIFDPYTNSEMPPEELFPDDGKEMDQFLAEGNELLPKDLLMEYIEYYDEKKNRTTPKDETITQPEVSNKTETTLRVNVDILETLMNLAGELVLSRNQLREAFSSNDQHSIAIGAQRLDLVTSELQDAIMRTRMQPIGNIFNKYQRTVRDMALKTGKEMRLEIIGANVEMDKNLIEGLSDPLMHMVRNSADHGIENSKERAYHGKPQCGTIRLEARHEAGQVIVEIKDDGKGIDPQKVAAKAMEKGLISEEKLSLMSEKEKIALIFLPGLSTAEIVSDISGRGVGMDVVRNNIEKLGGKVEIDSKVGHGTAIKIKLPLTLAIIPSLIITVQDELFAIPQINVLEMLYIPAKDIQNRIELIGNFETLLLRDKLLPVIDYADILGIIPTFIDPKTGQKEFCRRKRIVDRRSARYLNKQEEYTNLDKNLTADQLRKNHDRRSRMDSGLNIVIVTSGVLEYGLVVDGFLNTEEIVVKPLGHHLKKLSEYAGATIMGDGSVALIIDTSGLAARAELMPVSGSDRAVQLGEKSENEKLVDLNSFVTFYNGPNELCATPLDIVRRIEKIKFEAIEELGGKRVMQYRDDLLPLVMLDDVSKAKHIDQSQDLAVIVYTVNDKDVGLVCAMPIDVIDVKVKIDSNTLKQNGISGSFILKNKTVMLIDIYAIVEQVYPEWRQNNKEQNQHDDQQKATILLAEDSDFFRHQVKKFMEDEGYTVLAAEDGEVAWQMLQQNSDSVNIVVTDIEMPVLNGLGLSRKIRHDQRFENLPIIGLTSLAGDDDIARGKEAGINEYQIKLDRDNLIAGLKKLLVG